MKKNPQIKETLQSSFSKMSFTSCSFEKQVHNIQKTIEEWEKKEKNLFSSFIENEEHLYLGRITQKSLKEKINHFAVDLENSSAAVDLFLLDLQKSWEFFLKEESDKEKKEEEYFNPLKFYKSQKMTVSAWYTDMDRSKSFKKSRRYINRVIEWEKKEEKNMNEEASQNLKNCLNKHSGFYYKLIAIRNKPCQEDLNPDLFAELTADYESSLLELSRQCETLLPVIESKKPEILPGDQKNKKKKKKKIKKSNDIYDSSFENKEDPKEKDTPQENKEDSDTKYIKGETNNIGLWTQAISDKLEKLGKNLTGAFLLEPKFLEALRCCKKIQELSDIIDKRLEFETIARTKALSRRLSPGEKLCSVRINDSSDAKRLVFIIKTREKLEDAIDVESFKFVDYHKKKKK